MAALTDAVLAYLAANRLETVAALFGIVSVWLSTREHIASWPTAIVNVGLYFLVFRRAQLYADMWLQAIYLVLSCYGWYEWKFGGADRTELPVSRVTRREALRLIPIGLIAASGLALYFERHTDAALPWVDSALSVLSLIAQWMMTRKLLENWALWIVADIAYVAMFLSKALYVTAALYAVFLVLATKGYLDWRRSWLARASS
ncbi:MAG: nicotinamide mononucleotide transporter [Gemmatimonadaceae bacterium]|jgi:nicotinamide mononucleotide transporter|nr:nicotinamide mononucleotide transporter [Gemmatimonadaceae bacterium]